MSGALRVSFRPFLLAAVVVAIAPAGARAQNSTKKLRAAPSELAARAGTAVPWRGDVDEALAEARREHRPVFWYVAEVRPSPMDRKPEIDRYLRGGPFSWPSTIELLRTKFVPVAAPAAGARAKELDLVRNRFLEPGYVVLDEAGKVLLRVDQITTLHPEWFEAPLRRLVGAGAAGFPATPALADAWAAYRAGDRTLARELAEAVLGKQPASAVAAEAHWLCGACLRRDGDAAGARARWTALAAQFADEPWAWKAALEAEGHGPFTRGFEDFLPLPKQALAHDPDDGTRLPGVYDESELWRRGVQFLVAMDDGDGVVRDSIYDFGGTDSLPNVHAAVSCLVGEALLAATARDDLTAADLAAAEAMLLRLRRQAEGEGWLVLSDRDEILWARAYALRFLAAWRARRPADGQSLTEPLRRASAAVVLLQPETGVWFHEYGNPFAIATALQALAAARAAGVEVDQLVIDRGLRALAQNRGKAGAYSYGHTARGEPRATVEAAAGRMPLCELGLFLFGASDQPRLTAAIEAGERHHDLLAAVRKYDDHADRHGYGGFFFWFDVLGRAEAIVRVEDTPARRAFAASVHARVLALPEFDGVFVDSHELGRAYGTAMALLTLDALAAARR
jgi:hypothetical protein